MRGGTRKRPVALQVAEGHELAMKGITPRFARQVDPFLDSHAEKAWPYATLWPGDWIRGGIGKAKATHSVVPGTNGLGSSSRAAPMGGVVRYAWLPWEEVENADSFGFQAHRSDREMLNASNDRQQA